MIALLLAKDLLRAWRNPLPWVIHLAVPLLITGLIGLAFGRSGESGGLGRIKLAIVDEDDSPLTGFLRGALNQREAGQHIEPFFLKREQALRELTEDRLSAVVILPKGLTEDYLSGQQPVKLELIKNPAQSFYPAIVEEFLATVVTALNAVSRNFQAEFPEWHTALERPGGPDFRTVSDLVSRAGDKIQAARAYLFPPLIGYVPEKRAEESARGPAWNLFAYLLPGMAAMFLLFLADNAVRDLYRELRFRTFERFRTLHSRLFIRCLESPPGRGDFAHQRGDSVCRRGADFSNPVGAPFEDRVSRPGLCCVRRRLDGPGRSLRRQRAHG